MKYISLGAPNGYNNKLTEQPIIAKKMVYLLPNMSKMKPDATIITIETMFAIDASVV